MADSLTCRMRHQKLNVKEDAYGYLSPLGHLEGKRPKFPSGMSVGLRPSMPSWVLQGKREL